MDLLLLFYSIMLILVNFFCGLVFFILIIASLSFLIDVIKVKKKKKFNLHRSLYNVLIFNLFVLYAINAHYPIIISKEVPTSSIYSDDCKVYSIKYNDIEIKDIELYNYKDSIKNKILNKDTISINYIKRRKDNTIYSIDY